MDILSQRTLTLLRDENVRKTIDELIDHRETESKVVELKNADERNCGPEGVAVRVRIRRIA